MNMEEKTRIIATIEAYNAWRNTPVVDDDFQEMMERFDLEMGRLERMIK